MAGNPEWKALSIQIPGENLLHGAQNALEALMVYLEVTKAILETIKIFLVDFGNPIKAIAEALLQLIMDLFASLQRSGLYAWFDIPNPLKDPNFNQYLGGFRAFTERFKTSLIDPRDPNRPQPVKGSTISGYMLIVADAEEPLALMRYLETLLRFFGKEFLTPRFQAPASLKVLPLGRGNDPILAIVKVFEFQPKSIVLEWGLPEVASPGDPGFSDLIQGASIGFYPPRFLIEKSEINPAVGQLPIEKINDAGKVGQVVMMQPTNFLGYDKNGPKVPVSREVRMTDVHGDPFIKFQKYIVVDTTHNTASFILGQFGTFRYIDNDVEQDKTYYYRVRAYSGELDVSDTDSSLSFTEPKVSVVDKSLYIEWPGRPMMGKPSPIMQIMIPTYPERFDVLETLRRLFQVAFSLNFHLPMPADAEFDETGLAIAPTPVIDMGKGQLTGLAGPLTSFEAAPLLGKVSSGLAVTSTFGNSSSSLNIVDSLFGSGDVTEVYARDPATGLLPKQPWNKSAVIRNSARLANIVAGAMLGNNSAVPFKAFMEGPFPKGFPSVEGLNAANLLEMVYQITDVQDPEEAGPELLIAAGTLYDRVFWDPVIRLNMIEAVGFCKSFTLVGSQADWIQVSVLRDIVPWSGQLIYEILNAMQALVDAYAGVMAELRAFIDLIVRKIDTLERLLQYLISILDFIEGLSLGFYILSVPETNGGTPEWMSLLQSAQGTPPPSGPGGYTGGVAIAYVGTDPKPYAALKQVF